LTGADILSGIIGAVITVAVGIGLVGIQQWLKRRVHTTGPQAEAIAIHTQELAQVRPLVFMLVDIQKPILVALHAILGTIKEKEDGSFERADRSVRSALDTFDDTLRAIAKGGCSHKDEKDAS
jgi:hypothetical protein